METKENYRTPNKFFDGSPSVRLLNGKNLGGSPCIYNRNSIGHYTPNSLQRRNGTFHMFPSFTQTPPSRMPKIINPFEAALTERLHLPLICSPSLFHRPSTPQLSSTQFEWTIDDVSSLNPANLEAHETQFQSITDPEIEAKAQAAINTYFKEHIVVPSPREYPLRNQQFILDPKKNSEPAQTRDGICQTELTLPPCLPEVLEIALRPFFSYCVNQQQSPVRNCDISFIDHEARDASLRRKLFNTSHSTTISYNGLEDIELHALSPAPKTPELDYDKVDSKLRHFGSPTAIKNKTFNASISPVHSDKSFGSLSPISRLVPTPTRSLRSTSKNRTHHVSTSSLYRSTPDRSSVTVYRSCSSNSVNMMNMSIDDVKKRSVEQAGNCYNETAEMLTDNSIDGDISQVCANEDVKTCSQTNLLVTPVRSKRTIASRKNLSRSFCLMFDEDNMCEEEELQKCRSSELIIADQRSTFVKAVDDFIKDNKLLSKSDSGFNDMDGTYKQCCNINQNKQ